MLREGVTVDATLAKALSSKDDLTDLGMRSVFLNPDSGEVWAEGEAYTNPALADTMEVMAEAGDGAEDMGQPTLDNRLWTSRMFRMSRKPRTSRKFRLVTPRGPPHVLQDLHVLSCVF